MTRPAPMFRDAVANPEPSDEVVWAGTMKPGDIMHIPRGYWHQATRKDGGDGYSMHVTFGFTKRVGVNWLTWLADEARQHELFRHDLDRWGPNTTQAEQQANLSEAVSTLAEHHTFSDFLTARERQQPPARHIATHGIFGPPETVVCISDFPPLIETADGVVTVKAARKAIDFAAQALPALQLLLSGRPVNVADVGAATGVNAAKLAEVLVAEDMCADVTPELASGYTGLVSSEVQ